MARYIEADKLEKDFPQSVSKHNAIINGSEYPVFLVDHVLHEIRNYPTADVVEVKHGEWEKPTLNLECFADGYVICSECNVMLPNITEIPEYYYCPYCGAKMDGKDNNVPTK